MDIIILTSAAFITSSISAILGMGGGIVLLGVMAIIIPEGYTVIALHGIVQLISNISRSFIFRKHIRKNIIRQYLPGAILGLILSAILIIILNIIFKVQSANEIKLDFLKPLICIFTIWFIYRKRYKIKNNAPNFFTIGTISGLWTVFIGATGTLIAPFFKRKFN